MGTRKPEVPEAVVSCCLSPCNSLRRSGGRKRERARARETREGLRVSFSCARFFLRSLLPAPATQVIASHAGVFRGARPLRAREDKLFRSYVTHHRQFYGLNKKTFEIYLSSFVRKS